MRKKNIYVIPDVNGWAVKQERLTIPYKIMKQKEPAVRFGTILAKHYKSKLIILKKDGEIQSKNNFRNIRYHAKG